MKITEICPKVNNFTARADQDRKSFVDFIDKRIEYKVVPLKSQIKNLQEALQVRSA